MPGHTKLYYITLDPTNNISNPGAAHQNYTKSTAATASLYLCARCLYPDTLNERLQLPPLEGVDYKHLFAFWMDDSPW